MLSGFCPAVLEYCSALLFSAADTHLKLLDRALSGAMFLTGGMFQLDIAHRRSVAVLSTLCKIRCNPMHPLNGALSGPYGPERVTLGALVAHWYTYDLAVTRDFCSPLSVHLEQSWLPHIRWCGTGWFQEQGQYFFIGLSCSIPTIVFYSLFPFSLFCL